MLIGNFLDMPKPQDFEGLHWSKHKALYGTDLHLSTHKDIVSNSCAGPISSVTVLGTTLVLINDKDIAFDLLEKRSTIYSSRPSMTFAGEL